MIFRIIFCFTFCVFGGQTLTAQAPLPKPDMVRGVCWVAGDSIIHRNLDPLEKNHVNWISQTPFGLQSGYDNPEVRFSSSHGNWGESDKGLIHTARLAHDRGIQVILKPHIWLRSSSGKWRSDIEMCSLADWDIWFAQYTDFILHYAAVAEKGNMEALCIGTELQIASTRFPEKWIDMIRKIRTVYHGKLTYAANFYKEYEEITFWGHLDAIGIQGYFPLVKDKKPTKEALCASWMPHIKRMELMARKYGKPIIFTEVGYKNTDDAAIEPWVWPRRVADDVLECEDTQAICLDAMFESLSQLDWFDGVFIWKWYHTSYKYSQEEYAEYRAERIKRAIESGRRKPSHNFAFSPQDKKGELVIRDWFERISSSTF